VSTIAYDTLPTVRISDDRAAVAEGWRDVAAVLAGRVRSDPRCVVAVECYPGVLVDELEAAFADAFESAALVRTERALHPADELERRLLPYLGDDPVFGFMCPWGLDDFFASALVERLREEVARVRRGLVLVLGPGSALVVRDADVVVYADVTRWEIQQRQRRGETGNLGAGNAAAPAGRLYKRAYFVDWRAADRHKNAVLDRVDYYLDTNVPGSPRLVGGDLYRRALELTARRPFRLVPFFDPGPWGGEWMRRTFGLPSDAPNFAWCFDCVPEENSLLFEFGGRRVHSPALPLVHRHPLEVLGRDVYEAFGAEFPIRFDLLDTIEGGNLSLQVHPLRDYIHETFGMPYTQDESYYVLHAKPGAQVYLGLQPDVQRTQMAAALRAAGEAGKTFPADRFVAAWPARKHDHFSIPAGTVHCSGRDNLVLEISATPYIFTFKLWDWGRLGLDGRPRPIHLDHGLANIRWDRTADWVARNLVDRVTPVAAGGGWREESTGLHPLEFIETRRHWFTTAVEHDTQGTVNVLNLVEGAAALVESPADAFEPMTVHHAETFVVPAAVGAYRVRPVEAATPSPLATIKAYVRSPVPRHPPRKTATERA
jgi:mannose-6-phosphate isomerase class I